MVLRCYPYKCDCGHEFDVYKKMADIDRIEKCEKCEADLPKKNRMIVGGMFYGAKVEDAEYCPAMGQVVKNSKHRAKLAKERGLIEVGSEDPNKIHDSFEKERQKKSDESYDKYFNTSVEVQGK